MSAQLCTEKSERTELIALARSQWELVEGATRPHIDGFNAADKIDEFGRAAKSEYIRDQAKFVSDVFCSWANGRADNSDLADIIGNLEGIF